MMPSRKFVKNDKRLIGENNPSKRQDVREKLSQKAILRWANPDFRNKMNIVFNSESFKLIRHLATTGDNNPMSAKNQPKEKLLERARKVAETRKKNGSYKRNETQIEKQRQTVKDKYDLIGRKGIAVYHDLFNGRYKRWIKERFLYKCQECEMTERESRIKYNSGLVVHHIDYNKSNSDPQNLIPLCKSCHSKTNFNRELWIERFHNMTCGQYNEKTLINYTIEDVHKTLIK